ncbi:MAG: hypothetical protein WCF84_05405 [Anaerolineae bacterium]
MTAAVRTPNYGLWRQVFKLLRVSLLMSWLSFARARLGRKIGTIVLTIFALLFLAGIFAAAWGFLAFIREPEVAIMVDLSALLASLPAVVLTGVFVITLTLSFGVLLQGLYLAGDMEFLLSAPIPIRAVFVSKLLQTIVPDFLLICFFALPILWGLGAAEGYTPLYYPLVFVMLAAVVVAAAGLSSLLVLATARLFPPRLVAEVLGLLGAVIAISFSQIGQFARASDFQASQLGQGLDALTALNSDWSPLAWAGRGLIDIGVGEWGLGLALIAVMLAAGGVIFGAALITAERLYYSGWARLAVGHTRRPAHKRAEVAGAGAGVLSRLVSAPVRAILFKDALVIRRDLRTLSQLVAPLILAVIYAILFIRGGPSSLSGRGSSAALLSSLGWFLVYGNIAIALFIGWSFVSRLSLMSFSQEGKYYWLIKSAPVSSTQLLTTKFLVAYLPTLFLSAMFLLGISLAQGVGAGATLFGLFVVALCLAGGAGLYLAFGVTGARLDWTDSRRMVSTSASCLGSIVTGLYMLVDLGLFLVPPIAFSFLGLPELAGQVTGLALGSIVSLLCALVPLWGVRDRVARIGEGA